MTNIATLIRNNFLDKFLIENDVRKNIKVLHHEHTS